jgi:lysophospholipase L1-like esterase
VITKVLIAIALLVTAGEGIPRVLGMKPFQFGWPKGLFEADPDLGIRMVPNFTGSQEEDTFRVDVRVNALGMRGPEVGPKAPGEARILCVGDAETFGHGVEESQAWPAQLEAAMRARGVAAARALNAGVMAYGPAQETAWFPKLAAEVRPDVAVVGFTVANDFFDLLLSTPPTVKDGYPVGADFPDFTFGLRLWWFFKYHSTAYRMLARAFHEAETPTLCGWHPAFGVEAFRIEDTLDVKRAVGLLREQWRDRLLPTAEKEGVKVLVAPLPTRFQVDREWWDALVQRCHFDAMQFDLSKPQRLVKDLAAELAIPSADPLERFLSEGAGGGPLFDDDTLLRTHLTPRGHTVFAEVVADALASQGLLPRP